MSQKVINRVWEKGKTGGTTMLVLLALADIADDWGYSYPNLTELASKTKQSLDTLSEMLTKLERLGEIRRAAYEVVQIGDKHFSTVLYQVVSGMTLAEIEDSEKRSLLFQRISAAFKHADEKAETVVQPSLSVQRAGVRK